MHPRFEGRGSGELPRGSPGTIILRTAPGGLLTVPMLPDEHAARSLSFSGPSPSLLEGRGERERVLFISVSPDAQVIDDRSPPLSRRGEGAVGAALRARRRGASGVEPRAAGARALKVASVVV